LREGALTLQQGGGVGYDFSPLRPAGEAADAAGGPHRARCRSCTSGTRCARRSSRQAHGAAR
jgi:hypothetical protein